MSGRTSEVLVLNSAATNLVPTPLFFRQSVEIQNLGPNAIFVAYSQASAVINKARRLASGDTYSVSGSGFSLWAIAATADQVTGAATIVMELEP